jgi:hypothetical protein
MPETEQLPVKDLSLDLRNYRTVRQADEKSAVEAMSSASPDRFWALADSLIQDGYLPTESIIVLRDGSGRLIVREGNRRLAALKLIHSFLPLTHLNVPNDIARRIGAISPKWLRDNDTVPCTIYESADAATVDRIVTLAHGKGEKAARDQWNAVARARHNRDANGANEPALDLLEKYLKEGKNVTPDQAARWAGAFPLTILAEAMKRLAQRLAVTSSPALAKEYPAVKHREKLEAIIHDIGMENLGFEGIRRKDKDFVETYGIPLRRTKGTSSSSGSASSSKRDGKSKAGSTRTVTSVVTQKALAMGDPRAVRRLLRDFGPRGKKREKVVTLRDEAIRLDLNHTPLAFCFVLRSMFEVSAKAYCADQKSAGGPSTTKSGGEDRPLVNILRDITNYMTGNGSDKQKVKELHGPMTELGRRDGILSVTSMNQLVHHPRFSVLPADVAILFGNVFPLLEAMNS